MLFFSLLPKNQRMKLTYIHRPTPYCYKFSQVLRGWGKKKSLVSTGNFIGSPIILFFSLLPKNLKTKLTVHLEMHSELLNFANYHDDSKTTIVKIVNKIDLVAQLTLLCCRDARNLFLVYSSQYSQPHPSLSENIQCKPLT